MHRFFAPAMDPGDEVVALPRDEAEHLTRVLRVGIGDTVAVFDGRGHEFVAKVVSAARRDVRVQLLSRVEPAAEASPPWGPVPRLGHATRLVELTADTFWAARSGAELTATMEAIAGLRAKLDAVELAVVRELDAGATGQAALKEAGWASTNDFLTHTTGGRKGSGPKAASRVRPRSWTNYRTGRPGCGSASGRRGAPQRGRGPR